LASYLKLKDIFLYITSCYLFSDYVAEEQSHIALLDQG